MLPRPEGNLRDCASHCHISPQRLDRNASPEDTGRSDRIPLWCLSLEMVSPGPCLGFSERAEQGTRAGTLRAVASVAPAASLGGAWCSYVGGSGGFWLAGPAAHVRVAPWQKGTLNPDCSQAQFLCDVIWSWGSTERGNVFTAFMLPSHLLPNEEKGPQAHPSV